MVTDFMITSLEATRNEGMITVLGLQNRPGVAGKLFSALAQADIPLNTIVQNSPDDGYTSVTFTVARTTFNQAVEVCREHLTEIAEGLILEERVSRLTATGKNFEESSGVAASFFDALGKANINILAINANAAAISVFIKEEQLEAAERILRRSFSIATETA